MPFTIKQIKQLQERAKIRGYTVTPINGSPVAKKISPQKEWIELNLQYWCNKRSVDLVSEYKFAHDRKWRFDWCIPILKVAIEYEGIFSAKSRHTTISGFTGDIEKYNRASADGWVILRFTAKTYKNLINELNIIYNKNI